MGYTEKIHISDDLEEIEYLVCPDHKVMGLTEEELKKAVFTFIELKDKYTAGHCRNVAKNAAMLAHMAGFTPDEVDTIRDAGLLHDLGKVLVDKSILNKEGPLTDAEFYQMQSHSEKGMHCLSAFNFCDTIVDGAWHHHERCDGTGYPDGLTRNGILLSTRIISVADTADAMLRDRPYRSGLPIEKVRAELVRVKGTQLDKDITDMMIELIDCGKVH